MISYRAELHEVAGQLDLPQPVRARILLELAADLTDLEAELVSSGMSRDEAHRRAAQLLIPGPESLRDLQDLHRPLYRRLVDRFSDPLRHRLERAALLVVSAVLFAVAVFRLGQGGVLVDPTPTGAALLAVGLCVIVVALWKVFALTIGRDHDLARLRFGLWILPGAAIVASALALAGSALDLYGVAGRLEADASTQLAELLGWLRRDVGLLSLGLLTSGIALGCWLIIAAGIARVEQLEAEIVSGFERDTAERYLEPERS